MVAASDLYALAVTVLALVALAAAMPMLVDIAREGRERLRDGLEPLAEDGGTNGSDDPDSVRCPHSGTANEGEYAYCEACVRAL